MRISITFLFIFILSSSRLFAQEEGFEYFNPPITIVVLGSSTAAGAGTWPIDNAWVNLYRCYVQDFNPQNQVINLAKGGYNTYHLLPTGFYTKNRSAVDTMRNLTKALEFNPDGIIINLPSNDISSGFSVEEQLANFQHYQDFCDSHDINLWVTTTQARNFPSERKRILQHDLKDSLNNMFPQTIIDFWTGFCDENFNILKEFDSGDGCHMNNAGHKILTNRVIDSQAFRWELNETSFQRAVPNENPEELSPHMLEIGFKGRIEFDSANMNQKRFVKVIQEDRVLNAVEVSNTKYDIITIVDMRHPVKIEYQSPNTLTKVIELDFLQLLQKEDQRPTSTYYPIEVIDMSEFPLEELNYQLPYSSLIVAKFYYDSTKQRPRLNNSHVELQRQRLKDAAIQPPSKGKKLKTYWESGEKKSVLKFKNGQLNGKSKWFRENGSKERIISFKNGAYDGKYILYDAKGKKKSTQIFKNDEQIGETKLVE